MATAHQPVAAPVSEQGSAGGVTVQHDLHNFSRPRTAFMITGAMELAFVLGLIGLWTFGKPGALIGMLLGSPAAAGLSRLRKAYWQ